MDSSVLGVMLAMKRANESYYNFTVKHIAGMADISESTCRAALKRLMAENLVWEFESTKPQGSEGRNWNVTRKKVLYFPS